MHCPQTPALKLAQKRQVLCEWPIRPCRCACKQGTHALDTLSGFHTPVPSLNVHGLRRFKLHKCQCFDLCMTCYRASPGLTIRVVGAALLIKFSGTSESCEIRRACKPGWQGHMSILEKALAALPLSWLWMLLLPFHRGPSRSSCCR